MSEREELREKIAAIVGDAIDYDRELETDRQVADRILALLPPQPKLEWRGASLMLGELRVGMVTAWNEAYVVGRFEGRYDSVEEARTFVKQAVREALGWNG